MGMVAFARTAHVGAVAKFNGIVLMATEHTDPAAVVSQLEAAEYRRDSLKQLNAIRAGIAELHRLLLEGLSRGR
jgi:hypothetical protein